MLSRLANAKTVIHRVLQSGVLRGAQTLSMVIPDWSCTGYGKIEATGDSDGKRDKTVAIHDLIHNLPGSIYHPNSERYTNCY